MVRPAASFTVSAASAVRADVATSEDAVLAVVLPESEQAARPIVVASATTVAPIFCESFKTSPFGK